MNDDSFAELFKLFGRLVADNDGLGAASVDISTVRRLEGTSELRGSTEVLWKIQTALEAAGVEFIPADDTKGPGVRLKHKARG